MYFQVSIVPQDLIIEVENESDLKEVYKKITIEPLVFSTHRLNKEDFAKEMISRHIYLKS